MTKDPEPTTVTIDRNVFLDVAGSAYAAYLIARANSMVLVKRGLLSPDDATVVLADLIALAKRSGKLMELAVPRLEEALGEVKSAIERPRAEIN